MSLKKLFNLWSCSQNFGHLVARKWHQLMVSNHYLGYWSRNPLHIWCVHWLGEFSYFWFKLDKFGPSGGRKMAEVGGFWQSSRILIIKITSYWLGEFWKMTRFFAKYQHSGGQKWPKLMVYDNWTLSWHFVAMSTVELWRLSDGAAIRSLYLLVLIYMLTHLYKKEKRLMK